MLPLTKADKGRILLSEPFLEDPNFMRSVVLLVEHNEQGSLGFVLNQPTEWKLADVLGDSELPDIPLVKGGPVDLNTIHFIHLHGSKLKGAQLVKPGLWWGGHFEMALKLLRNDHTLSSKFKFFIGYSGWSSGQLLQELKQDSWIVSEISPALAVSPVVQSQQLWRDAMKKLGGTYEILGNSPLDPQWN